MACAKSGDDRPRWLPTDFPNVDATSRRGEANERTQAHRPRACERVRASVLIVTADRAPVALRLIGISEDE
jgi:hypothetical protein